MNARHYRLVFSEVHGELIPVPEQTRSHLCVIPGAAGARVYPLASPGLARILGGLLLGSLAFGQGLPTGGNVVAGGGSIAQDGATLTIQQDSQRMAVNWQGFSIGQGNSVVFRQPNAAAVALNRVLGGSRSEIYGSLSANGRVYLVNPNGVLFGAMAEVNVGGLLATTKAITDTDFMAGIDRFTREGSSGGGPGEVINQGNLRATEGGFIVLAADHAANTGTIAASGGAVALAAGETVALSLDPAGKVQVKVDGAALQALVENRGLIAADGGSVYLTARGKDQLQGQAINLSGVVQARSIGQRNGTIVIDGGASGVVSATDAKLDVSGLAAGEKGGSLSLTGQDVGLFGSTILDARGEAGGGTVLVGGGYRGGGSLAHAETVTADPGVSILVDAQAGDGGRAVLWSDEGTRFSGTISATGGRNGGQVEVSSRGRLAFDGLVSTMGTTGKTGSLLLDPYTIVVATSGGDITPATLTANLATTNVVLETASGGLGTAGAGNITVQDAISYTSSNSLSLLAQGSVSFKASVQNSGSGALNIVAGWDGSTGLSGGVVDLAALAGNTSSYGQGGGSVIIGDGTQTTGISVGTKTGTTTVLTNNLGLAGSTANTTSWALLGYHGNQTVGEVINGAITVRALGSVSLAGGSGGGLWSVYNNTGATGISYAQIGNGGFNGMNTGGTPNSTASVGGAIDIRSASLSLAGGNGEMTYAMIGNGGRADSAPTSGDIHIVTTANASLVGGTGGGFFQAAVIGNGFSGGYSRTGNITLAIGGNLTMTSGTNASVAKIGHGGYTTYGGYAPPAGWLSGTLSGDISVQVGGSLALAAGSGGGFPYYDFAQIGHGGSYDQQDMSGSILVKAGGDLNLVGGAGIASPALIGHAILDPDGRANRNLSGDITVVAGGELSLQDGAGGGYGTVNSVALVGHQTCGGRIGSSGGTRSSLFIQASGIDTSTSAYVTGAQVLPTTGSALFNKLFTGTLDGQGAMNNNNAFAQTGAGGNVSVVITGHDVQVPAMTFANYGKGNGVTLAAISGHSMTQTGVVTEQDTGSVVLVADQAYQNQAGGAPVVTSGGRWQIFSNSPLGNSGDLGTITPDYRRYGLDFSIDTTAGSLSFGAISGSGSVIPGTGNGMFYRVQPRWVCGDQTITYGAAPSLAVSGKVMLDSTDITSTLASYGLTDPSASLTEQLTGVTYSASSHVSAGSHANAFLATVAAGSAPAQQGFQLSTTTGTLTVNKATIASVTGITVGTKVYDRTTVSFLQTGSASFTGMVGGDSLSVASATGAFADPDAGSGKAVAITGITLGGADAGNYTLADGTASATGTIIQAHITAVTGITASNKAYDGTARATLDAGAAVFSGLLAGDSLTVDSATGRFADPGPGTHKQVGITGITLGGADARNYLLMDDTAMAYADITGGPSPRPSPEPVPSSPGWTDPEEAAARRSRSTASDTGRIDVTQSQESGDLRKVAAELVMARYRIIDGGLKRGVPTGAFIIRP